MKYQLQQGHPCTEDHLRRIMQDWMKETLTIDHPYLEDLLGAIQRQARLPDPEPGTVEIDLVALCSVLL